MSVMSAVCAGDTDVKPSRVKALASHSHLSVDMWPTEGRGRRSRSVLLLELPFVETSYI